MRDNRIMRAALPRMISLLLILCMLTSNLAGAVVFAITGEESENASDLNVESTSQSLSADAALNSAGTNSTSSDVNAVADGSEESVTATLYSTGSSSTGTPVVFTKDGMTTEGGSVPLSQKLSRGNNLLVIKWTFNVKEAHTLTITVPSGIYIDNGTWTPVGQTGSLLTNVSFESLDNDSNTSGLQQGVGKYSNSKTGTLTYTTAAIANADYTTTETIALYIGFDEAMWSKTKDDATREKEELSVGADPAVKISVDGSEAACLEEIYAGQDGGGIHTWNRSWPVQGVVSITTKDAVQYPLGFTLYDSEQNSHACWAIKEVRTKFQIVVLDSDEKTRDITIPVTGAQFWEDDVGKVKNTGTSFDSATQTFTVYDPTRNNIKPFYYVMPEFTVNENTGLNEGDVVQIKATNTLVMYNGLEVTLNTAVGSLTYYPNKPVMKFNAYSNEQIKYTQLQFDRNYVEVLGCISISNEGFAAAENVKITLKFDTDYDPDSGDLPDALVSAYRIPLPLNQTATITAYTISADGTTKGTKVFEIEENNTQEAQYSQVLVAADSGTYIYKIEYTIPQFTEQSILCDTGGWSNLNSTGHIYGLVGATTDASLTYSYTWEGETKEGTGTIAITAVESRTTGSRLILVPEEDFSVTAGGNETMTVKVSASTRQNSCATYLSNPVVFFAAPNGITVTGVKSGYSASTMTNAGTVNYKKTAADGSKIYELELNAPDGACGFTVGSTSLNLVNELYVQISYSVDPSLPDSSYALTGRLLVSNESDGKYAASGLGGTSGTYASSDSYDVDDDTTTKKFGSLDASLGRKMYITPLTSAMSYTTYVSETGKHNWRNGTSDQAELEIEPGTKYDYRVVMQNNSGDIIPRVNTALYIPLPHGGGGPLPDVMGGDEAIHAEARLISAVTGYNPEEWDVRYSIDGTAATYNNGQSSFETVVDGNTYATWLTAEEIQAQGLHFEDVVYIKMVPLVDFPEDYTGDLIMTLRVTSGVEDNHIIYSSAAWSQYDSYGTKVENGVLSNTAFTKVKIVPRTDDFTDKAEESNLTIIDEISLHTQTKKSEAGFENFGDVKFYITDISVHSFNLATQQSIQDGTATDVTQKDSTFGISIQLNALNAEGQGVNSALDLAEVYSSLDGAETNSYGVKGILLGTGYDYANNLVSLTLSNYDTIIDISTERYVDITLQNEYGSVTIIYRVYIHRQLTQIEVSTAILPGKYFNNLGGATSKEATVTGNSAVTAGFVINSFISDNFETGLYVSLTNGFPAGTGLTLIDITTQTAPQYYWYLVPAGGAQTVLLSAFQNMSGSGNFAPLQGDNINRTFLLIADFSKISSELTGDRTLSMTADRKQTAIDQSLADITMNLTIHFTAIRTFDISGTADPMTDGVMQLMLTLASGVGDGYDFLYNGRNDTIKLTFNNLPDGSHLLYNQKEYYPVTDGSGKSFIVDIPEITGTRTYTMTLHTPYQPVSSNTIAFTAYYMVAAPYCGYQAMGGRQMGSDAFSASVTTTAPAALSIDRKGNNGYHLATATQIASGIEFEVTRQGAASGKVLNWNVYQKSSTGYSATATASGTIATGSSSFNVAVSGASVGTSYRVVVSYGTETAVFNIIVVDNVG